MTVLDSLLTAPGVYAGAAYVNAERWPAAVNIGGNPTFGEQQLKVEAHLIGFEGPLYGEPVEIEFLTRLRDVKQFSGIDELKTQLARDVEAARQAATLDPA